MKSNPLAMKDPVKIPVLLPVPLSEPFDYVFEEELPPGTIVKVPFGSRQLFGIVWEHTQESTIAKKKPASIAYKPILKVVENIRLPLVSLKFIKWVSDYTLTSQGQILKMVLSIPEVFEKTPKTMESPHTAPQKPHLSKEQKIAVDSILQNPNAKPLLLEGVTGSGKTEVYFEIIESILKEGGQSLILLPEIALSTQWLQRFKARFGFDPAVWHSDLPPGKRKTAYRAILEGKASVMVGARSALFLPFPNLKLIIVDEEHDGSYKQEEGVIYNARDMAVVRAKLSHACCILASATPSLESEMNVASQKYEHIQLTSRYGGAQFPDVKLVDLRKIKLPSGSWISPLLRSSLEETLQRGEQAMLFLNRRGYAPLTLCEKCGDRLMCPQCSISLVQHKSHNKLLCHHCGYLTSQPSSCSSCHAEASFKSIGPGVERIYEEVKNFLPEARCALLTSDHLTTPKKIQECVENIQNHKIDFLIGTQIMAKGHHFPLLTLVGVIDGDSALSGSDLRAAEKSFQLLHQVA
jgi:primosomal protein N' (replication factor Y)